MKTGLTERLGTGRSWPPTWMGSSPSVLVQGRGPVLKPTPPSGRSSSPEHPPTARASLLLVDTTETEPDRRVPDPTLMAPDTAWWAKIGNAEKQRERLTEACKDFDDLDPFHVEAEPADHLDRTAYRLRLHRPIPVEISLIVGDLLHNLRSALDSLVFELTTRAAGRELTEKEEKACQFPISPDPDSFDKFFTDHGKTRVTISPEYLKNAIRSAQTFYWLADMKQRRFESAVTELDYAAEHRKSSLFAINHLSNLDKHRRLTVMAWWPAVVSWTADGESNRSFEAGDGTYEDGSIVGYVTGTDDGQPDDVNFEFGLTLADLPFRNDVINLAEAWTDATRGALRDVIEGWTRLAGPTANSYGAPPQTPATLPRGSGG
jgi:hypothetical protein